MSTNLRGSTTSSSSLLLDIRLGGAHAQAATAEMLNAKNT